MGRSPYEEGVGLIVGSVLRRVLGRKRYTRAVAVYGGLLLRRRLRREVSADIRHVVETDAPTVLVYQMAKVGSSTITWALREIDGLHVFQVHLLLPENLRRLRAALVKRGRRLARLQSDMDVRGAVYYRGLIKPA
jgi:hypothetical protein